MIEIISDKEEIKKLNDQFQKLLNNVFKDKIHCWVGYPGGNFERDVLYSEKFNLWKSDHSHKQSKHWNGFGIGRPIENKNNALVGEINFPNGGINRNIAGAFGKQGNNILILHRGLVGGGTKGLTKDFFKDNFRGEFIEALDDDKVNSFCFISELSSEYFEQNVSNFIYQIDRIKELLKNPLSMIREKESTYSFLKEGFGQSKVEVKNSIIINRTHGIVVNELARKLEELGHRVGNDKNRDLFIFNNNHIESLFEIKTDYSIQNICTALGQLIVYSIPHAHIKNKFLVIPFPLNKALMLKCNELKIKVIIFYWSDNIPIFENLERSLVSI